MQGISISNDSIIKSLVFPVSLEQTTRAEVKTTRSGNINKSKELIKDALERFKRALLLDPAYKKASNNLVICEFLLKDNYKIRKNYIDTLFGYDSKFINDLRVINMIIDGKTSKNKFRKFVNQGSDISKLNISDVGKVDADEKDKILRSLGLSPRIRWEQGEYLLESDFQLTIMNGFEIINNYDMEIAVIKIPESYLKVLTASQTKSLIKTIKGTYLVY